MPARPSRRGTALYLGEGFLGVSKQRRLPGEQASALQRHGHVSQLELGELGHVSCFIQQRSDLRHLVWFASRVNDDLRFKRIFISARQGSGRPYLHCLKLADGGAECHAFLRVVGGAVQRGLSDAECLGCDADSSAVQGLLRRSHTRKRDSGTEARGSHSFPDIIFQDIFSHYGDKLSHDTLMLSPVSLIIWKCFSTVVTCVLPRLLLFIPQTSDLQSTVIFYT